MATGKSELAKKAWAEGRVWAPISSGRPSKFTEEEMTVLVGECKAHLRAPSDRPIHSLAKRYGVSKSQLQRIVRAIDREEVPFRTRPSPEQREPFVDRVGMLRSEEEQVQKKIEAIEDKKKLRNQSGFERVRDILMDTPKGKPISEGAIHECLTVLAATTDTEGTIVKALLASREVARQTGEGTHLGPPPPLTDGDMVMSCVDIMRAIGMENSVNALKQAYGAYVNVSWKKLQKEDHDV